MLFWCECPALAYHLGVTLDKREAHPEQASGVALVRATRKSFYYLSAQVFGVGFHEPITPSKPTLLQDAVEVHLRPFAWLPQDKVARHKLINVINEENERVVIFRLIGGYGAIFAPSLR